jgi:ABC-type multidrug transport system ATPase subunit
MHVKGLRKKLGDFTLDINELDFSDTRVYGLIGPNGCGKTTTARLISGVLSPDAGAIDTQGLSPRDITMLSQKPYIMTGSVWDNLVYPLKIRRIKADRAECLARLNRFGLAHKEHQNARSLSGGEQQKLAFLRALIFKPRLIIADEAFTDLDIESLDMVEQLILDSQQREPVTWIVISHQLPHVLRLCDYVYFMHRGELEAQGECADLLLRSQNEKVRTYVQRESL